MARFSLVLAVAWSFPPILAAAETAAGVLTVPADNPQADIAERYRLAETYRGQYKLTHRYTLRHSGVTVYDLTFPSPIASDIPENNTVYAQYFVPSTHAHGLREGLAKVPAVIVLDIMQGNQLVARGEAMWLAQNGVAALVVVLPHYNERRAAGSNVKLVSPDLVRTFNGIQQAVLDCRCAAAWLAERPEVDAEQLGMVGTSLGSFITALTAANEPRIKNVCIVLGGGGLVDAYFNHPRAKPVAEWVDRLGGKNLVKKLIGLVDPITYADKLKRKNLLLIAARHDVIVPACAATALWEATDKPRMVWLDSGHVTAGFYTMTVLCEIRDHVRGMSAK